MQTFIYLEPSDEGIAPVAKQIAARVKQIPPAIRGPVRGIAIGGHLQNDSANQLAGLVDELLMVEAPQGSEYNTEVIANVLAAVVGENGPGTLFLTFSHQGMELAPAIGWRLGVPVVTSCTAVDWLGKEAKIRRNIFAGKLLLTSSVNMEAGAVISVQKGAWKDALNQFEGQEQASLPVTHRPWLNSWAAGKTEYLSVFEESMEGKEDITKAEILVSVGRGIGGVDNLPLAKQLAAELGGLLSCSRPVVDLGWLPAYRQVGISGKTVAPVVYLALGISGQNNHLMGMDGSEIVVAVNNDTSAPIFNIAKYGVIDDILEFIPELLEQASRDK